MRDICFFKRIKRVHHSGDVISLYEQRDALLRKYPELMNQTLQAFNEAGIVWQSLETGKIYLFTEKGKVEQL